MSPSAQTIVALLFVLAAAGGLLWRALARRGKPGCGSGCGCPTDDFKKNHVPRRLP